MSIWRVDLMSEIEIPKKNREEGSTGEPALPKDQVNNLPKAGVKTFTISISIWHLTNPFLFDSR